MNNRELESKIEPLGARRAAGRVPALAGLRMPLVLPLKPQALRFPNVSNWIRVRRLADVNSAFPTTASAASKKFISANDPAQGQSRVNSKRQGYKSFGHTVRSGCLYLRARTIKAIRNMFLAGLNLRHF
jgi:hypothetical protein